MRGCDLRGLDLRGLLRALQTPSLDREERPQGATSERVHSWCVRGTVSLAPEYWTSLDKTLWAWSQPCGRGSIGRGLQWAWSSMGEVLCGRGLSWTGFPVGVLPLGVVSSGCGPIGVATHGCGPIGRGSHGRGLVGRPRPLFPGRIPGRVPCGCPFPAHREVGQRRWVKGLGQRESGQPPWAS